ncbi:hypothetical protein BU26DRAFT_76768 [Trematosphaeria pertusa]|uniref:Uncharacterized protein n=1 Tax=Trematosphaeria pertusa TaxID=390896 RepID=A0A6A6I6B8_9PLEO|nr:uncharacterized protein BU26DRAFT_76768 [Trematosphaeria pertusa]KAF2245090.1 hypothetical protein BU26DRAFT_76768 [Trematosphaeria pertusa]
MWVMVGANNSRIQQDIPTQQRGPLGPHSAAKANYHTSNSHSASPSTSPPACTSAPTLFLLHTPTHPSSLARNATSPSSSLASSPPSHYVADSAPTNLHPTPSAGGTGQRAYTTALLQAELPAQGCGTLPWVSVLLPFAFPAQTLCLWQHRATRCRRCSWE